MQFEDWVIMSNMHNHPTTLVDVTKEYAEGTRPSVLFLRAKNEKKDKELKRAKQGGE